MNTSRLLPAVHKFGPKFFRNRFFRVTALHKFNSENVGTLSPTPNLGYLRSRRIHSSCFCGQKSISDGEDGDDKKPNLNSDTEGAGEMPNKSESSGSIPQSFSERFATFEDQQRVIQDMIEEQWDPVATEMEAPQRIKFPRGKTGVFDLAELVELLEEERAFDVCVIKIPKELDYADHMILVSVRSPRHMFALATFIRRRFKSKERKGSDILPRIEGLKTSQDWIALDLGNIILHIFMPEFREMIDLETLWTVGPQYDDLMHQKDTEIVQLLKLFQ